MKNRVISVIIVILLLILDWAALHDLVTGSEKSYMAEYLILIISVLVFVIMLIYTWFKSNKKTTGERIVDEEKG